jgi:hypothetical protein
MFGEVKRIDEEVESLQAELPPRQGARNCVA